MKTRKFARFVLVLAFVLSASSVFAASGTYNADNYKTYTYTRYGGNCFLFVDQVLRNEGRGSITYVSYERCEFLTQTGGKLIARHLNSDHNGKITESEVRAIFAQARVGDVLQMYWKWSRYSPHTAVISEIGSDYVEFLEANNPSGKIANHKYSFGTSAKGNYGALAKLYNNAGRSGGISLYRFGESVPVVTSAPSGGSLIAGETYSFQCNADVDATSWAVSDGTIPSSRESSSRSGLPSGLSISSTGKISGTVAHTSQGKSSFMHMYYYFNVTASNSAGSSDPKAGWLTVWEPPSITTSSTLARGYKSQSYNQTITAEGTEFSMNWRLKSGTLPPGLKLNSSSSSRKATITGKPTVSEGVYQFEIECSNFIGLPATTTTKWFSITIGNPPEATCPYRRFLYTFKNGRVGEYYSDWVRLTGESKYANTLTYTIGSLPLGLGLSLSGNNVWLRGTPAQNGSKTFTLTAHDNHGKTDGTFTVYTAPYGREDRWRKYSMYIYWTFKKGKLGEPYTDYVLAGGGSSPYWFELKSGSIPPGMTITSSETSSNQVYYYLRGTPQRYGTFNFTIRVVDGTKGYVDKTFSLVIDNNPSYARSFGDDDAYNKKATKPKIVTAKLPDAVIGSEVSIDIEAAGTEPILWTCSGKDLPEGFTVSETGKITGIPAEMKKYKFKLTAENAAGSVKKTFTLNVKGKKPSITTQDLPFGIAKENFAVKLEADGTEPITWSKSGKFPSGLRLNSKTGEITGKPTKAGTYNFTVKAKNKAGSESASLQITVYKEAPDKDTDSGDVASASSFVSSSEEDRLYSFNSLYVISGDEEFDGEVAAEPGKPVTFGIMGWTDEYGNEVDSPDVEILIDGTSVQGIKISEDGTFVLPAEYVNGVFTLNARAVSGDTEISSGTVTIRTDAEPETAEEPETSAENPSGSSGGCSTGASGIILMSLCVFITRRKK